MKKVDVIFLTVASPDEDRIFEPRTDLSLEHSYPWRGLTSTISD